MGFVLDLRAGALETASACEETSGATQFSSPTSVALRYLYQTLRSEMHPAHSFQ